MRIDRDFYKNRKVLITGHTGFKGTWMCQVLLELGAEVTGYALQPPTDPSLFSLTGMAEQMQSIEGDVRDLGHLLRVFEEVQPEIVIHMAAQPIVRESYANPVYTYDVNVMGTVNVLECVRRTASVRSFVNVTTDKVYKNREWEWGYRENEELNGFDPYSNSKSCSELVTYSYRNSFLRGKEIILRNPASTRPYQHVLEPVLAYLLIAEKQYRDGKYAGCYNVGPEETSCLTTGELVAMFCGQWKERTGIEPVCMIAAQGGPHEANFLKLDCSKIKSRLGWRPVWNAEKMMEATVEWIVAYSRRENVHEVMKKQIHEYLSCIQAETEKGKTEL